MYRPTIRSPFWLGLMTVSFILLYWWAEVSRQEVKDPLYNVKIDAAQTMLKALEALRDWRLPMLNGTQETTDEGLVYALLGDKDSPITTDEGRIEDKITALNPNFAAVLVQLLVEAGVRRGDTVAVAMTGSLPGANIACYAALKALGAYPVTIVSLGSSWWGANLPDFTWLDMERVLVEEGIFSFKSVAASLGGGDDNGGLRLSQLGSQLLVNAIRRNDVLLIQEGSLKANIEAREKLFNRYLPLENYRAFINIGGGIATIGHRENGRLIPNGVIKTLPSRNYPAKGIIHTFAEAKVPIVHIYDPVYIAKTYHLPVSQLVLPPIGKGEIYVTQRYKMGVVILAGVIMMGFLVMVKLFDYRYYKLKEVGVDPDTLL
ncbi:MAG: poly-gamma-glutamate system protein [bacterium]